MEHIIAILVENNAGVLSRVSGLFSRRGYNIRSLAVGETDDVRISRITVVVNGDEQILSQIEKQLNKLVEVIKVQVIPKDTRLARELVLAKVSCRPENRSELISIADVTGARVADVSAATMTLEISGNRGAIDSFLALLSPFSIAEIVRTGTIALRRGAETIVSEDGVPE